LLQFKVYPQNLFQLPRTVAKQLPIKSLISVRCEMLPLEKRILRSTLELVDSFLTLREFCTEHVTQAGAVLLSVLSSVTSSHLTGMIFEGSCANGVRGKSGLSRIFRAG
jgi:hypothetical protein